MTPTIPVALLTPDAINTLACSIFGGISIGDGGDGAVLDDWLKEHGFDIRHVARNETIYNMQLHSVVGDWYWHLMRQRRPDTTTTHKHFELVLQMLKPWLPPVPPRY